MITGLPPQSQRPHPSTDACCVLGVRLCPGNALGNTTQSLLCWDFRGGDRPATNQHGIHRHWNCVGRRVLAWGAQLRSSRPLRRTRGQRQLRRPFPKGGAPMVGKHGEVSVSPVVGTPPGTHHCGPSRRRGVNRQRQGLARGEGSCRWDRTSERTLGKVVGSVCRT